MCGMFFTFDKDNIPLLSDYNSRRGGVNQSLLEIDIDKIAYVGHFQAPTSVVSRVHPHEFKHDDENSMLWHNGILKEYEIKRLQNEFNLLDENWDTALLHEAIMRNNNLSDIDGSFAVFLFLKSSFYFSRNALVPLYINQDECIISSVKIKELGVTELLDHGGWYTIKNNKICDIDTDNKFNILRKFTTKNNPYNF